MTEPIHVVGAGLAGTEIALQLAAHEIPVVLTDIKPGKHTPAQRSDQFTELVCSNSFRSNNPENAVGLLKEEMRRAGSFILSFADETKVPAGDALAVDRDRFSQVANTALHRHPLIQIRHEEITALPDSTCVIATGPLTTPALAEDLCRAMGENQFYFYDAIAPIVSSDSLNHDIVFAQSRYDKGNGNDYLNCPLDKQQYDALVAALCAAEKVPFKDFEQPKYFEGCLPIEVMAERGPLTLAFGPMKPVGLCDPRTGQMPFAVVQLRKENISGTAYNLVGFQTKLTYPEQKRIFSMIPGLEHAEFLRLGAVHRNTFVNAPKVLHDGTQLKTKPNVFLAGQIVGVEGYLESAAHGFYVAKKLIAWRRQRLFAPPPRTTALGALVSHVTGTQASSVKEYGPENVHWGMVDPLPGRVKKTQKKALLVERARTDFSEWLKR